MEISHKNSPGCGGRRPCRAAKSADGRQCKGNGEEQCMPLVYICSAYSGDVAGNTEKAKRYSRFAVDSGAAALAPHLILPMYMDEETERELAISMDIIFLGKCDELWVFGAEREISEGMGMEICAAKQRGMKIRWFTERMEAEDKWD